jgi:hypothetical protein
MKILSIEKFFIGAVVRNDDSNLNMVNQYSIEILSENELLNNKFEKELQPVQEQQQVVIQEPLFNESELKLQVNEVHKCKYALFDDVNEFYVHLIENNVFLNELDVYLNDLTQKYRAKVIDASNKNSITVFFIDYRNCDENCCLENLLKINDYDLGNILSLPALAYLFLLRKLCKK